MVTSRVKHITPPEDTTPEVSQEVLRLKSLLQDNGWIMLMERIDQSIDYSIKQIMQPLPLGLDDEQEKVYYKDQEKIKMKVQCYEELKRLPQMMMSEYGETEFEVDRTDEV